MSRQTKIKRHTLALFGALALMAVVVSLHFSYSAVENDVLVSPQISGGLLSRHEGVLLSYGVDKSIQGCRAKLVVDAFDGVQTTRIHESNMFNSDSVTGDDRVYKTLDIPDDVGAGKIKLTVGGIFICNSLHNVYPRTAQLNTFYVRLLSPNDSEWESIRLEQLYLSKQVKDLEGKLAVVQPPLNVVPPALEIIPTPKYVPIPESTKKVVKKVAASSSSASGKLDFVPDPEKAPKLPDPEASRKLTKRDLPENFGSWINGITIGE